MHFREATGAPGCPAALARSWVRAPLAACCLLLAAGCTQNPYLLQRQITALEQQNQTLVAQHQELQTRADSLDHDNQELEVLIAQGKQRERVVEQQLAAVQEQLGDTAGQLARSQQQLAEREKKVEALSASQRRRAGASISANDSTLETMPRVDLPGAQVRRDGDVIRIELPADRLFAAGQATLVQDAPAALDAVAAEIAATYPENRIGVEGHTDNAPPQQSQYPNNHQLSVARATAVYEYLSARTDLRAEQLAIAGHGGGRPVVSNASDAGRARNRRIELVIYPDRAAGR